MVEYLGLQVDKTNLVCRFQNTDGTDSTTTYAGYFLEAGQVILVCDIPSHAAGVVVLSLSLDDGQNWLTGNPSDLSAVELTYAACNIGQVAPSINKPCEPCLAGSFSNYTGATSCTVCPTGCNETLCGVI